MNNVARALKNWQDYKEIRVSGDYKPTTNAEKLIALFTKVAGQGTFEIARVQVGKHRECILYHETIEPI